MGSIIKWIKGYKSMSFGAVLIFLGQLQQQDLVNIVPPQYVGTVMSIIGLLAMVLRAATTTPVGVTEPQPLPSEVLAAVQSVKTEVQMAVTGPALAQDRAKGMFS